MIHAVRCDQPQFKTVLFQPGFNVILAERTKESTQKDSRNGLGKSTLIEIIHFCLGSNVRKGKGVRRNPLKDWTFSIDLDLRGQRYTIHRNTQRPGYVFISGDYSFWPVKKSRIDPTTQELSLPIDEWNAVLAWLMFDLNSPEEDEKYWPTFRSLISYFIRRGRDAFSIPFEHHRKQPEWSKQVNNAFLLGLGWEYARRWQMLKDRDKALKQLKEVAGSGLMPNLLGTIGELEITKIRLENKVAKEQKQLRTFKVHPQYHDIEEEANAFTSKIHQLTNENVAGRRMVEFYEKSLEDEHPADEERVNEIYEEAGIILPGAVVKRLEEVQEFHRRITANRRHFLEQEIKSLKNALFDREEQIRHYTTERAELLAILQTHGALEEYTTLQQRHVQLVSQLEEVKIRIENLKKFEHEKSALKIEQEQLTLEARADYEERQSIRQQAISLFNANSEALYEVPGKLIINIEPTGFKFQVEIERADSQGIEQMKVFSYDLMLTQLWSGEKYGPDFLIHDSTIFDGVDERQIAHALQLAAQEAEQLNFQYICCLNSDLIPAQDFEEGFDLKHYTRLVLTDDREDGGLLGFRF